MTRAGEKDQEIPVKIFEFTCRELAEHFDRRYGKGLFHAAALYREIFQKGNLDFKDAPEFMASPNFTHRLKNEISVYLAPVVQVQKETEVIKFVSRMHDGVAVESVIIPMARHKTLCLSSQAGCRMGCRFCETARLGFRRNLTVEEIVGQVFTARFRFDRSIRNIVFMGMGEPADNWDNVVRAMRVMNDPRGLDIAMSHMTLSTVAPPNGLSRISMLAEPRLNLAVSINGPNDRIRSRLMPINNLLGMETLHRQLSAYPLRKAGAFFIEYVLIKGVNDADAHARELANYLKPLRVKVNIIPYNPGGSNAVFQAPSETDVARFTDRLIEKKVFVRKRTTKGRSVMAACGQLGNRQHPPINSDRHLLLGGGRNDWGLN
jgi:23S rRNA (adenine2503-C2)-methyltransferase